MNKGSPSPRSAVRNLGGHQYDFLGSKAITLDRADQRSLKTAISSLKDIFASKDKKIIDLNERALKKGWEEAGGRG